MNEILNRNMILKKITVSVLLIFLLFSGACSPSLVSLESPDLNSVTDVLGYSLAPTLLPKGFEFDWHNVVETGEDSIASINYKRLQNSTYQYILIMYPLSLPPSVYDVLTTESMVLKWRRPDDAVSEFMINGEKARLVYGNWSAESMGKLENHDLNFLTTFIPEWDYFTYLSMYFDYKIPSGETIGVMVQASPNAVEWIDTADLIEIAESIKLGN